VVESNTPLLLALKEKAAAYPPEKKYNKAAVERAAEKVRTLGVSLPVLVYSTRACVCDLDEFFSHKMSDWIDTWYRTGPGKLTCAVPDNEPVLAKLLERVCSYPAEKNDATTGGTLKSHWQREAYFRAALSLAAHPISLKEKPHTAWEIKGTGGQTQSFIRATTNNLFSPVKCELNRFVYSELDGFARRLPLGEQYGVMARAIAELAEPLKLDNIERLLPFITSDHSQLIRRFIYVSRPPHLC
jgi:hypothetical protein